MNTQRMASHALIAGDAAQLRGALVRPVRRVLRTEDGIALVVAIGVLLVVGVIATGVVAVSGAAKLQTSADRSSGAALAAAESTLRMATMYLNQATPISDGTCPGAGANAVAATTVAVGGQCGPYTATSPDGSTESFVISAGSNAPIACSGAQVNAPTRPRLTIHQRCVTATAVSRGATRRAQVRLASVGFIFPIPGILGLEGVKLGQGSGSTLTLAQCASPSTLPAGTSEIMGSVGTNGTLTTALSCWLGDPGDVTYGNSAQLYMGLGAPTTNGTSPNPSITGAQPGGTVHLSYKLSIPPIDGLFQSGQDGVSDISLPAGDSNATGIKASSCTGAPYSTVTRVLALPNNGCTVTLDGSNDINHPKVYDFCGVSLPNNGVLSVTDPTSYPYVQVYIDSAARTRIDGTPACSSGSGTLTMGNGSSILANATSSLGAQIFIYGTSDALGTGTNSIAWRNSADVKMLLVAPKAKISFQNGGTITGGLAAYSVEANNNIQIIWDREVDQVQRRALYYRTSYTECAGAPTVAGDPHSGC